MTATTATTTLAITAEGEEITITVAATELAGLALIFIANGVSFRIA